MPYKDPAKQRAFQLEWIHVRRREWIEANGPCRKCGSPERLECDHVDPSAKAMSPRALWSLATDNPVRVAELAKCQVLCYECHSEKTRRENGEVFANKHRRPLLTVDRVAEIRASLSEGLSHRTIAKSVGLHASTIGKISRGQIRGHAIAA
jgi:5-methylcytosine-specific restriction endonuclease McrA